MGQKDVVGSAWKRYHRLPSRQYQEASQRHNFCSIWKAKANISVNFNQIFICEMCRPRSAAHKHRSAEIGLQTLTQHIAWRLCCIKHGKPLLAASQMVGRCARNAVRVCNGYWIINLIHDDTMQSNWDGRPQKLVWVGLFFTTTHRICDAMCANMCVWARLAFIFIRANNCRMNSKWIPRQMRIQGVPLCM